jgi:hypothetical protein
MCDYADFGDFEFNCVRIGGEPFVLTWYEKHVQHIFITQTLYQDAPHMLTTIKNVKAFAEVRRPNNYCNSESKFTDRDVMDVSSYVITVYYYETDHGTFP